MYVYRVFPNKVCLLFSPSLWTPPMPPVTNTGMPAWCAAIIVADTVVPPESPWENNIHLQVTAFKTYMTDSGNQSGWDPVRFVFEMSVLWSHFADDVGQITAGHLQGALAAGEVVELCWRQTNMDFTLNHSNRSWSGSFSSHNGLHLLCCAALIHYRHSLSMIKTTMSCWYEWVYRHFKRGTSGCVDRACHVW